MSDYEHAYRELRERATKLLRDRIDAEVEKVALATPEWRVRDIAAHLGGVCDDIAHGNMDGVASTAWTQAQVEKRRDWPFVAVLDDWAENAAVVEPMMNGIGHPMGQMVFDAWTHEQDIRGTLGVPCDRESVAMDISFAWWIATAQQFAPESSDGSEPEPFRLVTEAGEFDLGPGTPEHWLRTSRFEFLRAVTGRRSRAQVKGLDWDGDKPFDDLVFPNDVFSPAIHDIIE